MDDLISRQATLDLVTADKPQLLDADALYMEIEDLPSAQPDNSVAKIADLVEGSIDHFDLDDAMDLLYQIKEVLQHG